MGYDKNRGDSVRVVAAPFQAPTEPTEEALPLWQQPWLRDLLRTAAVPGALTLVALALIFGVIRPTLKDAFAPPPAPTEDEKVAQLDAVVDDATALPGEEGVGTPLLENSAAVNGKLEAARQLARDNPAAVANIMREWVTGEAA